MPEQTYSERIPDSSGALDPTKQSKPVSRWWLLFVAGIVVLIFVAILRPQWLAKTGLHISTGASAVGNLNPMGWV